MPFLSSWRVVELPDDVFYFQCECDAHDLCAIDIDRAFRHYTPLVTRGWLSQSLDAEYESHIRLVIQRKTCASAVLCLAAC